ncbi:MAG: pyrimidine operon attenuation protein/uracil phosphoribosyltransferase [Octadecabacter sp.]|jgi:pyrimidine operon attenuation protein/uracil phosphoribosyltransferase
MEAITPNKTIIDDVLMFGATFSVATEAINNVRPVDVCVLALVQRVDDD